MRKITLLATAVVMLSFVTTAGAGGLGRPCTTAPQAQWLPMQTLQAKVEALGYRVQKSKLKNACGEIYARDRNNNRVELFVDPTSGKIVGRL